MDVKEELFPGLTMKFTASQIIVTGSSATPTGVSPVWFYDENNPDAPYTPDTWSFKDTNKQIADVIKRGSDGREITIVKISSTELIIQMEWDQTTYGRTASLPGIYEFTLTKQ
jgi:hypothetical protein